MNNITNLSVQNSSIILTKPEQWGFSFLGVTLGILSIFIAPLIFMCFKQEKIKYKLNWLSVFGSGIIISMVMSYNINQIIRMNNFNWKIASALLGGIFTNKLLLYGFIKTEKQLEIRNLNNIEDEEENIEAGNIENSSETKKNKCCNLSICKKNSSIQLNNVFKKQKWTIPLLIGNAFCNLANGIVISSAFLICGLTSGFLTTATIVIHESIRKIGDLSIILNSGLNIKKAILLIFMCSCLSYIGWLIVNIIGYVDTTNIVISYLLAFGSGILLSVGMSILPIYLNSRDLNLQRLKLILFLFSLIFGILMFNLFPSC